MIRKYIEADNDYINGIEPFALIEMSYHGDVLPDDKYTLVRDEAPVGVIYFKRHYTWYSDAEQLNRIQPCIVCEEDDVFYELLEFATDWLSVQDELCKDKRAALAAWVDHSDINELSAYMKRGFIEYETCPVLKYDLSGEVPVPSIPTEFSISRLDISSQEELERYIDATRVANDGSHDSVAELCFMSNEPSFSAYMLKDGDSVAAVCSTWRITDERAAIENICCVPDYRRKGLTQALMLYVLGQIKESGYSIATLSMRGRNLPAHRLYHRLGFELMTNQIELVYPR